MDLESGSRTKGPAAAAAAPAGTRPRRARRPRRGCARPRVGAFARARQEGRTLAAAAHTLCPPSPGRRPARAAKRRARVAALPCRRPRPRGWPQSPRRLPPAGPAPRSGSLVAHRRPFKAEWPLRRPPPRPRAAGTPSPAAASSQSSSEEETPRGSARDVVRGPPLWRGHDRDRRGAPRRPARLQFPAGK